MKKFIEKIPVLRLLYNHRNAQGAISRREMLRIGGLAGLSLAAQSTCAAGGQSSVGKPLGFGRAKSVILIYASGGQSQIDTWDPKPNASEDVRGEFRPISSALPGVSLCEHMPRLAKMADRYTILRSMSHEDLDHGSATYLTLTGRYHLRKSSNPDPSINDFPTYGAVLKRVRPTDQFFYDAIHLNGPALVPIKISPGQNGGFLGREYEPLVLGDVNRESVALPGLEPHDELPPLRLESRRSLKETLDSYAGELSKNRKSLDMNRLYSKALDMLSSTKCRAAFDLGAEPPKLRERYGRNRSGQACLLARRLVEAGVPLVTVMWNHSNRGQDLSPEVTDEYGWDTHNDIFKALKNRLLPRFDLGFSALLEDLDNRGMLDETLVICMGEFGRAPHVALEPRFAGATPGRKHWSSVYSIVLAGAGVTRGSVLGASDRLGAEPKTERYGPWDIAATIYNALGIDHRIHYNDSLRGPIPICIGQPIEGLYRG